MKAGQFVVRSRPPGRRKALVVALVVAAVAAAGALFELGVYVGGHQRLAAAEREAELERALEEAAGRERRLSERITVLERTKVIDDKAYEEVRDSLLKLQEEILELRQEVEFYRGIVSPAERQAGLSIQSFQLEPAAEEGLYHYELVLTQMLKNDKFVRGTVKIRVEGVQEGEPVSHTFKALTPNNSVRRDFRFRYFQKLEGDVRLPEGFVPRDVVVEMAPKGRKTISRAFPWESLVPL